MIKKILLAFLISTSIMIPNLSFVKADTRVEVEVKQSKIANMYYEIFDNGKHLKEDIEFELLDKNGNILLVVKTINSILFIENVDFGDYILRPVPGKYNKEFNIKVDLEYLKTHHILKPLEIGNKKQPINNDENNHIDKDDNEEGPGTGDNSNIEFYISGFLLSSISLILLLILNRKKYANIYYEVLDNGSHLNEEINFKLLDKDEKVIIEKLTEESVLLIKDVPFGEYVLKVQNEKYDKEFELKLDKEYKKTHDELKPLEINT